MNQNSEFLGKDRLRNLFWRLSFPAIISQIIIMIYNIVDRIFIGQIKEIGGLALTGLGICAPLIVIISAFAQLLCAGGGPTMSYALGNGKTQEAKNIVKTCFIVLMVTSILLTLVILLFVKPLLYLFGASDATYQYAHQYMKWYSLGTVSVMISTGMIVFVTAQGMAKPAMLMISAGALVNVVLDPLFIWVLNLGVEGAAIATIISQTVSAILILRFLLFNKSVVTLSFSASHFRMDALFQCLALGISPFIMQITESGLSIAFNKSLLAYGGDVAVGAMAIFSTINSFFFLPVSGFCQGAQAITSYNYGAGYYHRVAENIKRLVTVCVSYTFILWLAVMLFPKVFISVFSSDPNITQYSLNHIRPFFAAACITGLQPAFQYSFLALKNAKASLVLALLRKVFLLIPLILILPLFFAPKDMAVFAAEPIADTIAVITTTISFLLINRSVFKREMQN